MIKLIIVDNKRCQIICDENTINDLRRLLSYKAAGVEYTPAYQNGWNGITFLINKKGIFSLGLLSKVKEFLIERNLKFEEQDNRVLPDKTQSIDLSSKLLSLKMIPRDYQDSIVQAACSNRKGIVRACTGSGKTLCTALITAKLNRPTIIYVIGLDLLKQFHDLFSSLFDEPIGYIGDGIYNIERINIASIWTIGRALKVDNKSIFSDENDDSDELETFDEHQSVKILKVLQKTKLHIFDESHVVTTKTIETIHKNIDPEYIYGFSGTPFRDDNTDLLIHSILGEKIIDVSASSLISRGILAQPIIKFITVPKLPNLYKSNYPSVYKAYIVENNFRNNLIVKNVKMLLEKKYVPLVLFKQIKHGQLLLEKMEENNIKCAMLYGDDPIERRTEVKEMLINKEIEVILASTIFDLGVDLPILNALILSGGGKSSIRALQRIGRVIRYYPGKKFAAIIDFFDQAKFLKQHSNRRFEIYSSETGFKVSPASGMTLLE